jgi:cell division protein FtsN
MPQADGYHIYRIQVGAYKGAQNAKEVFDRLTALGFVPAYERSGELYRVVLSGVRSQDVAEVARILGAAGFREVIAREEN